MFAKHESTASAVLFYFYHNGGFCIETYNQLRSSRLGKIGLHPNVRLQHLTHKLDTALKSHDDTLNTKADTSAVTAVQQEVAAAREANCLVKLAGPLVTTATNAAMEFDLSQVDMTKVAALFVVFSAGGSGEIKLSANDTVVSSICSNNFYNRCNFHCCPYP